MRNWRRRAYQIGHTYGFAEGLPTKREVLLFAMKRATSGLPSPQAVIAAHLARQGYQDGAYACAAHSETVGFCTRCGASLDGDENFCGQCGRQARVQRANGVLSGGPPRLTEGHVLNRLLRSGRVRVRNTSAHDLVLNVATRPSGWRGHTY
jgi:hypothetical protein